MTMLSSDIASHFRTGIDEITAVKGSEHLVNAPNAREGASVGAQLFQVSAELYAHPSSRSLREECFGPLALVIRYADDEQLTEALRVTDPALTFSVFATAGDDDAPWLLGSPRQRPDASS